MTFRGLAALAMLGAALLVGACGGGSGRRGTDLAVTGTGPTTSVQAGQNAVFEMAVSNLGPNSAENVTVTNMIGNGLSLSSITCTASGGATCPNPTSVVMTLASIPSGGQLNFEVTTTLSQAANGTVTNTMSAEFDSDTNRGNNSFTVAASAFNVSSNLVVSGTGPGGTVTGGGTVAFQMTVTNTGPDTATNLRITDNPGSFLALQSVTCAAAGGATCPAAPSVQMSLDSMPAGGTLTFTVNANVGQTANGTLVNTMQVTADTDSNRADNSFTATATAVTPTTGVFATGIGPVGTVAGGDTVVFTMTVGNAGPDTAPTVSITDNVGTGLTLTGVTCTAATGGAVCPAALGPVMSTDPMPANSSLVFAVSAKVAANLTGTLINTMTVQADNDSNRSDNVATATATAATPRATLVVTGAGPTQTVAGGGSAVFTMTVGNSGPDPATNLTVVNTVGSNLTFTGATCSASGGATCPATVGVVTNVDSLPVGGLLTFSVSALVANGANGAITNTIQVGADNAFTSSALGVGQASTARSSLVVTGTGPNNVASGTTANFVMTVSNTGPDVAAAVHLVDTVGGNLTLTGISCTGAACPSATGPTMDLSNLAVGDSVVFTVSATVAPGTQGSIVNTLDATVTSGTRSEVVAVAVGSAYSNNVVVSGNAPAGPLTGGASSAFTMVVSNNGPGPALNVNVTNTLSSGLSANGPIVCGDGGTGICPVSPAATMTIASIPANGTLTFTIPVTVTAGTNATVSDTMSATTTGDSRAADNSATASVNAVSPDLGVSESGAAQTTAGTSAVFTAVVSNPTSAAATNLVLASTVTATDSNVDLSQVSIVCSAASGASCPTALGPNMSVASLPAGRFLTFTITVPVPAVARGTITSAFSVASSGDPNGNNNQASVTTTAVDPRSGSYKAFGADGRMYDMAIDFDAGTYTMVGANGTAQRSFTADSTGGGFTVGGNQRFRVATDLISGGHDFGNGVLPFVAGRNFGSTVSEAVGSYNLMTRDVPSSGAPATHAAVASISGNTLYVCQPDSGGLFAVSSCPVALKNYALTVSNNVYTATEVGGSSVFTFYLVHSDALKAIIGAGPSSASLAQLHIGLIDAPALVGGTLAGASTTGNWIPSMALTGSSYAVSGSGGTDDATASLFVVSGSGVTSMLVGLRNTDNQRLWVMQNSPLAVAFGDFTDAGNGKGLLQITLP